MQTSRNRLIFFRDPVTLFRETDISPEVFQKRGSATNIFIERERERERERQGERER